MEAAAVCVQRSHLQASGTPGSASLFFAMLGPRAARNTSGLGSSSAAVV